jgi:hypothetical protein
MPYMTDKPDVDSAEYVSGSAPAPVINEVRAIPSEDSAVSARVAVINEVQAVPDPEDDIGWRLSLQWCRYNYSDGGSELGYRFIWRKPNGNLQAARGQARLPSRKLVDFLFEQAAKEGWGERDDGTKWEGLK